MNPEEQNKGETHGKIQSLLYKPSHHLRLQPAAKAEKAHHRGGHWQHRFTNKYAAIKIHFGEPGNLAFLRPNYAKVVADTVKELGGKPFLTDCNTLYVGGRKKRPGPPGRRL